VREDRLLVVSDLHLGNRLHSVRRRFTEFLRFAVDHDYSVCINGDGIDIQQLSLPSLTRDLTPSVALFLEAGRGGRAVYFTVGNHDIQLEHFVSALEHLRVVPFLNVHSGDQRFRVEHGHTYDTMFLNYPRFYWLATMAGRLAIAISPGFYEWMNGLNLRFIAAVEYVASGFTRYEERIKDTEGDIIHGERECFREGAEMVGVRGFDAVIFGHTHLEGEVALSTGVRYFNTGSWFGHPHCVAIDRGRLWFGPVSELTSQGDPFPREVGAGVEGDGR
jgi:UDP-2,3-diacylglucosamine pyrophosphatase LpxH